MDLGIRLSRTNVVLKLPLVNEMSNAIPKV